MLVTALEIERPAIGAGIHLRVAQHDHLGPTGNRLPDVIVGFEIVARLIDIRELHRIAQLDRAGVGLFLPGQHLEKRGFTRAVRADHADDAAGRQGKGEIFDQELVAHVLFQPLDLDHLVAQTLAIGDDDLRTADALALGLTGKLVIGVDPGLLLGLPRLGPLPHPFEFALQRLLLGFILARLLQEALGLLVEPGRVIALIGDAPAPIQLENPACDVIEEIAVVGNDQDRALVGNEMLLQPGDGFRVKVVGRFVQEQHVGRFEQELAERHAAAFAPRERRHGRVIGRAAQGLHRDVDLAVEIPEVLAVDLVLQLRHLVGGLVAIVHRQFIETVELGLFLGHAQHHIAPHIEAVIQMRFLRQVAHARALGGPSLAREILVHPGHDPHQGGFARPVHAHHADLHPRQKVEVDVLKAFLAARIGLGDALHVIDILIRCHDVPLRSAWVSSNSARVIPVWACGGNGLCVCGSEGAPDFALHRPRRWQ